MREADARLIQSSSISSGHVEALSIRRRSNESSSAHAIYASSRSIPMVRAVYTSQSSVTASVSTVPEYGMRCGWRSPRRSVRDRRDAARRLRLLGRDANPGRLPVVAWVAHRARVLPYGRDARRRGRRLRRGAGAPGLRSSAAEPRIGADAGLTHLPARRARIWRVDGGHDRGGLTPSTALLAPDASLERRGSRASSAR